MRFSEYYKALCFASMWIFREEEATQRLCFALHRFENGFKKLEETHLRMKECDMPRRAQTNYQPGVRLPAAVRAAATNDSD